MSGNIWFLLLLNHYLGLYERLLKNSLRFMNEKYKNNALKPGWFLRQFFFHFHFLAQIYYGVLKGFITIFSLHTIFFLITHDHVWLLCCTKELITTFKSWCNLLWQVFDNGWYETRSLLPDRPIISGFIQCVKKIDKLIWIIFFLIFFFYCII